MSILIACLLAAPAPAPPNAAEGTLNARVLLAGHRAELNSDEETVELTFSVLAKNTLPVAIEAVELGLLFAEDEETLRAVDPGTAYRSDAPSVDGVGVVRRRMPLALAPDAGQEVSLAVALGPGLPQPRVFRTHVLSYRLAAVPPALLFELIGGQAAPDEGAVVETLALSAAAEERLAARRRWQGETVLLAGLVAYLAEPVGDDANHRQTLEWVFAVRTLGLLGGQLARGTLQSLLDDERLTAFDESLQVLRIARMEGSRLETPLAFAVPVEARRMQDVIAAALTDAADLESLAGQEEPPGPAEPTPAEPLNEAEPAISEAPTVPDWVWAAAIGLVVGALAALALRPRRGPPPASKSPTEGEGN